jgi:hypothetical protein
MTDLRQNTAATVRIGRFVDSGDAVTPEVALTITPALRRLSKNGGAFAATSDGSNAVHDSDGWYSCTLTATDLNTAGSLEMGVVVAGAAPYQRAWRVLPAQAYDALYVNPLIAKAIQYGTAQGGGAAAITLASTASTTDDRYNGRLVYIYDGTATGEVGYVQDYVGSSRGCVMAANWVTAPDATSRYIVLPWAAMSTLAEVADAIHDEAVDGATTFRQSIRLANSALGGKASGLATTTAVYRDLADTKARITATVDADGNRSAVTRDLT